MKKITKVWLITASALLLIGAIIFTGVMMVFKWDFTRLSTLNYETNEYEITEDFKNISLESDTADIIFALSDDGKCKIVCYEASNKKHSVGVQDDTLTIKVNKKAWYHYIGINLGSPKITLYLPNNEYSSLLLKASTGDVKIPEELKFQNASITVSTGSTEFYATVIEKLKIKADTGAISVKGSSLGLLELTTSTGKIAVSDASCTDANITVSTGKAELNNIQCNNLISRGDTGDFTLNNVVASGDFNFVRSTGDIKFDGCDAAEINIRTDTGDVTGSLLTDKVFITSTDTGAVNVPKTLSGGKCEITTDTGDIKITIK